MKQIRKQLNGLRPTSRATLPLLVMVLAIAPLCLLGSTALRATEEVPTAAEVEEIVEVIEKAYYEAQEALEGMPQERFDRFAVLEATDHEV